MQPRPYQSEAMGLALNYAAENPTGRLLLVMPTRSGKTFVGARLMDLLAVRQGLRGLWLAHREELLDEAKAHLIEAGIDRDSIGMIKSGRSSDPTASVQVASEQTLARRHFPIAHLVITDESHRDTAPRRRRIRAAYPKAFFLGLSATPKPPPQRDLGEDYDSLMVVVQPSELIHDGWLAVPTVYAPHESAIPDLRGLRLSNGDFRPDDLEPLLTHRALLDEQVSEWVRLNGGRTSIAYTVTVAHSRALHERFRAAGIPARQLEGTTGSAERRAIIAGMHAGEIPIVCSVGVLSEGTNIPRVKCILGARPTRSLTLDIQTKMRCATPWNDVKPRVLDVVGNAYEHGLPYDDRRWSLVNRESGISIGPAKGAVKRCSHCGVLTNITAISCSECNRPFGSGTIPSVVGEPLRLCEFEVGRGKLAEERKRLIAFATEKKFLDPNAWAERVIAAKHGAAA